MCGGFTAPGAPSDKAKQLAQKHKAEAEGKLGKKFAKWDVVSASTQVVAGTNYNIKIDTGAEHVHLKIYEPLPGQGESQLSSCEAHAPGHEGHAHGPGQHHGHHHA